MSQPATRNNREAKATARLGRSSKDTTPSPSATTIVHATGEPPKQAPRRRSRWLVLLAVLGPGVISAAAGNDAGGITTFSQVGAKYGISLLWALALVTIGLIVVQEMCTRLGAVTGKGLAGLIRENFGLKIAFFAMSILVIANFAITVSEFAGIAAVGEMFLRPIGFSARASRLIVVPISVVLVWLLVRRGSYQKVERIFLISSAIFLVYIITALKIGVPWAAVGQATFAPDWKNMGWSVGLLAMIVQLIGTTISPYMQFYQQAAVRDKGISIKDYALAKWDTIIGCILSSLVAAFIVITCSQTLHLDPKLQNIDSANQVALALKPLAGNYAQLLFAFGLLNASLMAATVVPLSTAFAVTEALGWESGMGRRLRELPLFYGTYGLLILFSGMVIAFAPAHSNLIDIIAKAQNINCALLPIELVLMLLLINRRRVMGHYRNNIGQNIVAWTTTVVAAVLSIVYLVWHPS